MEMYAYACARPRREAGSSDTPVAVSTPRTQILASECSSLTGLLGEMADSRAEEEHLGLPKKSECAGKMTGPQSRRHRAHLKSTD